MLNSWLDVQSVADIQRAIRLRRDAIENARAGKQILEADLEDTFDEEKREDVAKLGLSRKKISSKPIELKKIKVSLFVESLWSREETYLQE